ncbi:MAG: hypothetical protein RIR00_713 [Pseudomonadota bacterium]|jgi:acid stress-induced BolA-like protein IbaG/YrbA
MMQPEKIETMIRAGMSCEQLQVTGDGSHFEAIVVSPAFAGQNRIQRQKLVMGTVSDVLRSGELHALSIRTFTPDEWSRQHG